MIKNSMIEKIHPDIENEYNEIVGLKYHDVKKKLIDLAYDTENESDALKSSMIKWAVICIRAWNLMIMLNVLNRLVVHLSIDAPARKTKQYIMR